MENVIMTLQDKNSENNIKVEFNYDTEAQQLDYNVESSEAYQGEQPKQDLVLFLANMFLMALHSNSQLAEESTGMTEPTTEVVE